MRSTRFSTTPMRRRRFMRSPEFWERPGLRPALLAPLGHLYAAIGRMRRRIVRPWRAPVPVVCVGALTAGGAGKTPTAIAVARRLAAMGRKPHILTRGYKGRLAGPVQVDIRSHTSREVGDEALLLAEAAPTWVARNRIAGARSAVAAGADVLVLDDGFQNPHLAKDLSLVVIDGGQGVGNGRLLPAGPLRESIARGLERAQAVVLVGKDRTGLAARVPRKLPLLRARLVPDTAGAAILRGKRVLAFAGIGRPQKFLDSLQEVGAKVVEQRLFADHHAYRVAELEALMAAAAKLDAIPVTTAKDAVRVPPGGCDKLRVLDVALAFDRPDELDGLLATLKRVRA
jgi:tetraacyldisaccharide 4'-kinase